MPGNGWKADGPACLPSILGLARQHRRMSKCLVLPDGDGQLDPLRSPIHYFASFAASWRVSGDVMTGKSNAWPCGVQPRRKKQAGPAKQRGRPVRCFSCTLGKA